MHCVVDIPNAWQEIIYICNYLFDNFGKGIEITAILGDLYATVEGSV